MPVAGDAVTALLALVVALLGVLACRAARAMRRADAARIAAEWDAARRSLTVADVRLAATTCAPAWLRERAP